MSNLRRSVWEIEGAITALRKHHADGLSCSQIATALNREFKGFGVSRNAVIGKLNRLGLSREAPAKPVARPVARPIKTSNPIGPIGVAEAKRRAEGRERAIRAEKALAATKPGGRTATAKPFTERKIDECWWPIGEGVDMLQCCAKVTRGGLCAEHAERGYQKASTQSERKRAASSFLYHAGQTRQGYVAGKRGGALAE